MTAVPVRLRLFIPRESVLWWNRGSELRCSATLDSNGPFSRDTGVCVRPRKLGLP